jgi:hypothetical protein
LTKNGPSASSKRRGAAKKPETEGASAHGYDPLYVDSSGEEDEMEDIQPSSPLRRPASATELSDNASTRCFNELLKARNEVSLLTMCLGFFLSFHQTATQNKFANPDDLIHERSIHHLSLLTVEGECYTFYQQRTVPD